jgi:hypothetical protein
MDDDDDDDDLEDLFVTWIYDVRSKWMSCSPICLLVPFY